MILSSKAEGSTQFSVSGEAELKVVELKPGSWSSNPRPVLCACPARPRCGFLGSFVHVLANLRNECQRPQISPGFQMEEKQNEWIVSWYFSLQGEPTRLSQVCLREVQVKPCRFPSGLWDLAHTATGKLNSLSFPRTWTSWPSEEQGETGLPGLHGW